MPVQNNNSKISASPDLTSQLLQIITPTTSNSPMCQKGQITHQPFHRRWFFKKIFGFYPQKVKIEKYSQKFLPVQKACRSSGNCLSKIQARQVLANALDDQTQVNSKPACQPEHASLNQRQLIALNWCASDGGDQVSL